METGGFFLFLLLALIGIAIHQLSGSVDRPARRGRTRPQKCQRRSDRSTAPFEAKHSHHAAPKQTVSGPAYIVDGDTIRIRKTQIRLFGVDAPEIDHPYGQKAKWALVKLCKGQDVRAEIREVDTHGRTVAVCFLPDGRDLSAEMVKLGLAIDWSKFSGGRYSKHEQPDVRKKLWLADARQRGRMDVWHRFERGQRARCAAAGQS